MPSDVSKAVYDSVRHLRGEPDDKVREAVTAAFRRYGEERPSSLEIKLLVDMVQTSPRRVILSQLRKGLRWTSQFLSEARRSSSPRWMDSPADANCIEWDDDEASLFAPVIIESDAVATVQRIFADTPQSWGHTREPLETTTVREIECWCELDLEPDGSSVVAVFVGAKRIGHLSEPGASIARHLLTSESSRRLAFEGRLTGIDMNHGTIEVELPDRC